MADISRLLNEASGRGEQVRRRLESDEPKKEFSPAEDAAKKQAYINWLSSTITEEMFVTIGLQAKGLEQAATDLAINSISEEARIKVTHLLIKARALREIIEKFGKTQ